jgi:anaerobic selenocysteine-containing dehydrogenase
MDRRDFIKLTADYRHHRHACRFVATGAPDHSGSCRTDELVPGVRRVEAEWGVRCAGAGCGVTARVMEADVETVRNGQSRRREDGRREEAGRTAGPSISQGGLCPRGQASIQITFHPIGLRIR